MQKLSVMLFLIVVLFFSVIMSGVFCSFYQNVTEFWKINHFVAHETIRIFMFNLELP